MNASDERHIYLYMDSNIILEVFYFGRCFI